MSKPELKDGYIQLAYELDAALDVADLTKAERIVLNAMKAQLYGGAKLKKGLVVVLNVAARGDWKRQFVEKGIKTLLSANILVRVDGNTFRLNKYYRTWKFADGTALGTGSRFTEGELKYIADAPKIAKSYEHTLSNQRVANEATNELQKQPTSCEPLQPTSCLESNQRVASEATNELRANGPPYNPPCESPASEDFRKIPEEGEIDPPFPPGNVQTWKIDDAAGRLASKVADRYRDGDENGPYYRSEARLHLASYPEDVIERALLDAFGRARTRTGKGIFAYIASSLPTFLERARSSAAGANGVPAAAPARSKEEVELAEVASVERLKREYAELTSKSRAHR